VSYLAIAPRAAKWTAHANVVAYVIFQAPFSASFTSAVLFQDALILWPFSAQAHVMIGHTVFHNFFYSHTDIYGDPPPTER
jgi:hypothetical protein